MSYNPAMRMDHHMFDNVFVNPEAYKAFVETDASLAEINPLDTGRGRLIPTTSCDQFFAELALWLGVSKSNLPLIFPNSQRFRRALMFR